MFDWIQVIIDWIVSLFVKVTVLDHCETDPRKHIGYAFSNDWIDRSVKEIGEMAELSAVNKHTATHFEVLSSGERGYYDKIDEALDKFFPRAREYMKRNIFVKANIFNCNFTDLCNPKYSRDIVIHIIGRFRQEFDVDDLQKIEIQMCSEWGPKQRNKKCWRKFESWCNWVAGAYPYFKGWNKSARPRTAPVGHVINYHPASTSNLGVRGCCVLTDHSTLLKQLGQWVNNTFDIGKTIPYMRNVWNYGNGIILYHFACKKGYDKAIIIAIGELIKTLGKR